MANDEAKKAAGRAAAALVENGMCIGLGSGSTANSFHIALAERMHKEGIRVEGVAPSRRTEEHCAALGIPLVRLGRERTLDLAVDGADEIGPGLALIKGGGGALVREKLVVAAAREFVVIADDTKAVPMLGEFPLPVAVIPFGWQTTQQRIREQFGVEPTVRGGEETPFLSDDGLYILDVPFQQIAEPAALYDKLRSVVGVVDCGLFIGMAHRALLGQTDGRVLEITRS
ncbi:MAG: ribose-5-phosphate isomerase RpiA [Armatimonadaceae bacterium]